MTSRELEQHCKDNGVPYSLVGDKLRVMDLTQLPDGMRAEFDERGFFSPSEEKEKAAPVEVDETSEELPEDLSSLSAVELKDQARELGISGFSSMTKDELVKAIKKANK